jgi:thioredoxin-dependent peroxiredoxin
MSDIYLDNYSMNTNGELPTLGETAPSFTLAAMDLLPVSLDDFKDQIVVISTYPSIDTEVCYSCVNIFEQHAKKHPSVAFLGVSMDLPFALKRTAKGEGLNNTHFLSDFRTRTFAVDYGILIQNGPLAGMIARSLIVLDQQQSVRHVQLVQDLNAQPDIAEVIACL